MKKAVYGDKGIAFIVESTTNNIVIYRNDLCICSIDKVGDNFVGTFNINHNADLIGSAVKLAITTRNRKNRNEL